MGGRGASSSAGSINRGEVKAVYDYLERTGRTRIGANSKAYQYALNNATDIRRYDRDTGTMVQATREEIKKEVADFGSGNTGYTMIKSGGDEFSLHYSSNDFYRFRLKRK